ncbi:MAG: hypothetical protein NT062_15765 [Proteobacteria bacterium]|nr:hypothetical protein [Pseudomonadota bacterium]
MVGAGGERDTEEESIHPRIYAWIARARGLDGSASIRGSAWALASFVVEHLNELQREQLVIERGLDVDDEEEADEDDDDIEAWHAAIKKRRLPIVVGRSQSK